MLGTVEVVTNDDRGAPIEIGGLVKTFGNVRALDGLDLTVERGEVHGFLGPNGAGKSTTIRVLLGLLRKNAGEVRLFGGDPWRDAAELHRRLAYVPGDVNLWPNLTGGQAIDLLGRLRGGLDEKRRAELVERGIEVSEVQDFDWGSFVFFSDPDGNGWAIQQIPPQP